MFTVTFDLFNASLLNKSINFLKTLLIPNYWMVVYIFKLYNGIYQSTMALQSDSIPMLTLQFWFVRACEMCPVKYYIKQFNLKLRPAQESGTVTDTGKVSQLSSMCVTGECTGNCGHPQKAKWQGGTVVVGNYNLFLHNIVLFFLLSLSLTFSHSLLLS